MVAGKMPALRWSVPNDLCSEGVREEKPIYQTSPRGPHTRTSHRM